MLAIFFAACEPMEHRVELKSASAPSDIKFKVTQKAGYDNVVYIENLMTNALPFWDLGIGISNKQKDTVLYAFAGKHTIKFSAYGAGGPVADSATFTVTQNDPNYFQNPAWNHIANGLAGRTWVWAFDNPYTPTGASGNHICNGTGGYKDDNWNVANALDWWKNDSPQAGEITFDLNGAANFTKKDGSGNVVQKAFFEIATYPTPGNVYNVFIVLKAGGTWLNDDDQATSTYYPNAALRIWKLTDDELILIRPHTRYGGSQRVFYMKRKGYNY